MAQITASVIVADGYCTTMGTGNVPRYEGEGLEAEDRDVAKVLGVAGDNE